MSTGVRNLLEASTMSPAPTPSGQGSAVLLEPSGLARPFPLQTSPWADTQT